MKLLNSRILGDSPNHFIIVHGLFGQLDNWNTLGRRFSEHFTVHLIDLRNHGRSFHDSDTSHDAMAKDLINYIDHHNLNKACFLGHSLGGKVVMNLALNYPDRVEKLVIADMAPKTYPPHHQGIIKGLESVDFSKVKQRSDAEDFLIPYIKSPSVRQFLMKNIYRISDENYAFRFNLKALSETYESLVSSSLPNSQFTNPVLFLGGEESDYIQAEDREIIESYFPNAKIKTIKNAGHWLHAENPEDFYDKTQRFLNDI